jgi:hypothetical protein
LVVDYSMREIFMSVKTYESMRCWVEPWRWFEVLERMLPKKGFEWVDFPAFSLMLLSSMLLLIWLAYWLAATVDD